jgi:hypothetical protein
MLIEEVFILVLLLAVIIIFFMCSNSKEGMNVADSLDTTDLQDNKENQSKPIYTLRGTPIKFKQIDTTIPLIKDVGENGDIIEVPDSNTYEKKLNSPAYNYEYLVPSPELCGTTTNFREVMSAQTDMYRL